MRVLTAAFALLLAFFGSVAAPVSRIGAGRDSSAIVWIAERDAELVRTRAHVRAPRSQAPVRVEYHSRIVNRPPLFDLFQRPPPINS